MAPVRRTFPRPNPTPSHRQDSGKTTALVAALGLVMVAGTLYGLWELTGGLPGGGVEPLERGSRDASRAGASETPLQSTGADRTRSDAARPQPANGRPVDENGVGDGTSPAFPSPDGPTVRRQLATVARTFRTANPDLRGLNELVRSLAHACEVIEASVERTAGGTRGNVRLAGTDLEGTFTVDGDLHRLLFVETSYDRVHPPYTGIELDLSFATPRRALTDASARLSFVPNLSRKALDHISPGAELRIGWSVEFGTDGARARGIGARVADDLESWRVAPSDARRDDPRVRDLSSFQAWRTTLARD